MTAAILSSLVAAPADAKKVYRCGNTYQDQPCPEAKPDTRAGTQPPNPPSKPPECNKTDAARDGKSCAGGAVGSAQEVARARQ